MAIIYYNRKAAPVGGTIRLEAQFKDNAGIKRDTATFPTVEIKDGYGTVVRAASNTSVSRLGPGKYRLEYVVDSSFVAGAWSDIWTGSLDGSVLTAGFDFVVDPGGVVEASGSSVRKPEMRIGDIPHIVYSQEEIYGINVLMNRLRFRLQNTQFKPSGQKCDIFSIEQMTAFLELAISEFNATPTITTYLFSDSTLYTIFADILVEGAYLKAIAAIIPAETAREWVATDDGVSITPASVSGALNNVFGSMYAEYRAKLKEAKRNHRPAPLGLSAGYPLGGGPSQYRRMTVGKQHRYL